MLKRIDFYTLPDDPSCAEMRKFLETQDLDLRIRDLAVRPLSVAEISNLIRHIDMKHFINVSSKAYRKFHLDKVTPARKEMIELMASDNELLRTPIIVAGRLMTVGCNRQKILEMLQIKISEADAAAENSRNDQEGKSSKTT